MPELPDVDEAAARTLRGILAAEPEGRELTDDELITLLAAYGIPLLATRTVTDADAAVAAAAEVGYPVVLKSTAPWLVASLRPRRGATRPARRRGRPRRVRGHPVR